MILIYKTYSAERANLDHVTAHDFFVRDVLDRGLVHKVDPDNLARGVVLYDPDKWDDLVEAVNASNDEFDEMDDDDADEMTTLEEGNAKFVSKVTVTDPDSKLEVELMVFKDERTNGMFALDASWVEQSDTLDERGCISSPFEEDVNLILTGI